MAFILAALYIFAIIVLLQINTYFGLAFMFGVALFGKAFLPQIKGYIGVLDFLRGDELHVKKLWTKGKSVH